METCLECGAPGGEHKIICPVLARRREEADRADRVRRRDALPKWEYRIVASWPDRSDIEMVNAKLNEIGAEGWELVAILSYWYHFKRRVV